MYKYSLFWHRAKSYFICTRSLRHMCTKYKHNWSLHHLDITANMQKLYHSIWISLPNFFHCTEPHFIFDIITEMWLPEHVVPTKKWPEIFNLLKLTTLYLQVFLVIVQTYVERSWNTRGSCLEQDTDIDRQAPLYYIFFKKLKMSRHYVPWKSSRVKTWRKSPWISGLSSPDLLSWVICVRYFCFGFLLSYFCVNWHALFLRETVNWWFVICVLHIYKCALHSTRGNTPAGRAQLVFHNVPNGKTYP